MPPAWCTQTRPGGRIVTPWATAYHAGLLGLTVGDDGVARGGIVGPASFMRLRAQRLPRYELAWVKEAAGPPRESVSTLHAWRVAGNPAAAMAIGLSVPGCEKFFHAEDGDDSGGTLYLVDQAGSWASLELTDDRAYPVRRAGPRDLWDEVARAYEHWCDLGAPAIEEWLFTVSETGQSVQLGPQAARSTQR